MYYVVGIYRLESHVSVVKTTQNSNRKREIDRKVCDENAKKEGET